MNDVTIELIQGDITQQPDVEAIVNAANARLVPGGGVAGAIHKAAGPELYEEAKELAPVEPGQCVITKAYDLPNEYVIHCLGPVYGKDEPADKLLADCYRHAIELAEREGIQSIAFPSISTGAFGYPIEEAAQIALDTVKDAARDANSLQLIRFVLFSQSDLATFKSHQ